MQFPVNNNFFKHFFFFAFYVLVLIIATYYLLRWIFLLHFTDSQINDATSSQSTSHDQPNEVSRYNPAIENVRDQ